MKLKITLFILMGSLFFSVSGIAAAESQPVMFEDIDTNVDGAISKQEAKVRKDLYKNFKQADSDKNGTIDVDEYTAFHNKGRMDVEEVETPEFGAAPVK